MTAVFTAVKKFICLIVSSLALITSLQRGDLGTASYFPQPQSAFMARSAGMPLVAAHRTGKGNAPENTLMALEAAVAAGDEVDMFEIDIQITSDGELVLYHSLYLDENSDAAEYFGRANTTVFSKTYAQLRNLNMGENFNRGGKYPYRGLRGADIPDNLRILKLADFFDWLAARGLAQRYLYSIEVKYPFPWGPSMVDQLAVILEQRGLVGNAVIGSYWADITAYIDCAYSGRLQRFASIAECLQLYSAYYCGEDLTGVDLPYIALSLPYYEDDNRMMIAHCGDAAFIDYAHRYGLAMCYWTVNTDGDVRALAAAGADVLMTDYPEKVYDIIHAG